MQSSPRGAMTKADIDVEKQSDEEAQPLLPPSSSRPVANRRGSYLFNASTGLITAGDEVTTPQSGRDWDEGVHDAMTYSTTTLTTWNVFRSNSRTVWLKPELWWMMARLSLVALVTCILTLITVSNPAVFKTAKFAAVSKFLNVVVGMLLGFFLSSSMLRWHSSVNGFLDLLDALKNLHVQFLALGVREEDLITVLRYGYGSAWLLYESLKCETDHVTKGSSDPDGMWKRISEKHARIDPKGELKVLNEREIAVLKTVRDPTHILWTWVGVLLGGLAQDGWIPPMNSPTYGRIMNICQNAHAAVREVKLSITVQAPLTYCHSLALLVHINNLISAVTMGIVSGLAVGTALLAHDIHFHKFLPFGHPEHDASLRESDQDWQNLAITGIYCFFGPVLFQGLLMISMSLAQPFQAAESEIPMQILLFKAEQDLSDSRESVKTMGFKMPSFKENLEKPKGQKKDEEAVDGGE